jgi:uncharacterized lipoprotein YajG
MNLKSLTVSLLALAVAGTITLAGCKKPESTEATTNEVGAPNEMMNETTTTTTTTSAAPEAGATATTTTTTTSAAPAAGAEHEAGHEAAH